MSILLQESNNEKKLKLIAVDGFFIEIDSNNEKKLKLIYPSH